MPESPQEMAARADFVMAKCRQRQHVTLADLENLKNMVHELVDRYEEAVDDMAALDAEIDELSKLPAQAEDTRALARALWSALHEATDDWGHIARIDPDLDVDERLPYWLTGVTGAPETWQHGTDGDA